MGIRTINPRDSIVLALDQPNRQRIQRALNARFRTQSTPSILWSGLQRRFDRDLLARFHSATVRLNGETWQLFVVPPRFKYFIGADCLAR